ncbi:MAG: 30S ribosomal protein S4 [Candidatus Heimdallarchaeota archaeon]|nr:30S ribosomal protein S4 [Candidatus Heimdallarchaeota archaeon]MDH5647856.1 30S ribosomal protein S4 [Candidatus Heimdallarchaeota archaeon]
MGDPKRSRKKFHSPGHPYEKPRIESELIVVGKYGLRSKRELWRARTALGNYRAQARSLLGLEEQDRLKMEKILIDKLARLGIVKEGTTTDDILGLEVESVLNRRLQTRVLELGLAGTIHQARQLITHRHIAVNNKVMTSPGFIVPLELDNKITYTSNSPFNDASHPLSPSLQRQGGGIVEIPTRAPERRNRR